MRLLYLSVFIICFYSVQGFQKVEIDSLHQQAYQLLETNADSALILGSLAETKAANAGLDWEQANSLFIQAYVYSEKGESGKAFVLYLKALEILRPLKDDKAIAGYVKMLLNTGAILNEHHAYTQAVMYYDEAIQLAEKHQMSKQLIKLYHNKAEALRQLKKLDQALATIESGLRLAHVEKNEHQILSSLNRQGLILKDMGRYEEARESYRRMIGFKFDQVPPEKYRGQAWHNIAVTYVEEKKYTEAESAYLEAAKENEKRPDSQRKYITWMDLGEVYYLMGHYQKAYEMEQKALALYDDVLLQPDHYVIFSLLSKITYKLGEHDQSHTYSRRFEEVNKSFLQAQKEILQIKDQYKMEILTAGFFLELQASKTREQHRMLLMILACAVLFFGVLFSYEKIKQYKVRRSIKKAILDIEQESEIC